MAFATLPRGSLAGLGSVNPNPVIRGFIGTDDPIGIADQSIDFNNPAPFGSDSMMSQEGGGLLSSFLSIFTGNALGGIAGVVGIAAGLFGISSRFTAADTQRMQLQLQIRQRMLAYMERDLLRRRQLRDSMAANRVTAVSRGLGLGAASVVNSRDRAEFNRQARVRDRDRAIESMQDNLRRNQINSRLYAGVVMDIGGIAAGFARNRRSRGGSGGSSGSST